MKNLKLIAVGIILLVSSATQAQVSVSLNIGTAPSWGPSGYANIDYYYLPDVQAYYDIRASQFIYFGGRSWVRSRYLPRHHRNYDLNSGYKVVLNDYHGNRPYTNFHNDRTRYYKGYRGESSRKIGRRHYDNSYSNNRNADNRRYAENRKSSNKHGKYDRKRDPNRNDHHENRNQKENRGHGKH